MDQRGMDARAIESLLYTRSGLLGVSGLSSDMRVLLSSKQPRAALAIDLFVYRIGRELGSLAAALGGLDAIVFTGGIGEHAAPIRAETLAELGVLGAVTHPELNATHGAASNGRITSEKSRLLALVVPTNEELVIAREAARLASTHAQH
jgi:acetate kinase